MHRYFYTQMLYTFLHTDAFIHTQTLLETDPTRSFCKQTFLHTGAFKHSFYAQMLLQRRFYTQKLLHTDACTHRTLLHTNAFTHTDPFTVPAKVAKYNQREDLKM